MKKYLVICVSSESGVCSIDPFDTEKEAQDFLEKDSKNNFEVIKNNAGEDNVNLYIGDNYTQLTDGEYSWNWTIHQIIV